MEPLACFANHASFDRQRRLFGYLVRPERNLPLTLPPHRVDAVHELLEQWALLHAFPFRTRSSSRIAFLSSRHWSAVRSSISSLIPPAKLAEPSRAGDDGPLLGPRQQCSLQRLVSLVIEVPRQQPSEQRCLEEDEAHRHYTQIAYIRKSKGHSLLGKKARSERRKTGRSSGFRVDARVSAASQLSSARNRIDIERD
jgi:hypothetical protein